MIQESLVFIDNLGARIYKGYEFGIQVTGMGILGRISLINKLINKKTCYEMIELLKKKSNSIKEYEENVKNLFKNKSIMANYGNNKFYIVSDVNFQKSPETTEFPWKSIQINLSAKWQHGKYQPHRLL